MTPIEDSGISDLDRIPDEEALDDLLGQPTESVLKSMSRTDGDFLFLGVAGKIGPSLARMTRRASEILGVERNVYGASRFTDSTVEEQLRGWGIKILRGDLLDSEFVRSLPDVPNVIYLVAKKFGATGNEPLTWAMNAHLPSVICQKFRHSKIVALSTGNVYGMASTDGEGSRESDVLHPVGEYAMSCPGKERLFAHFSQTLGLPMSIIRLNYAVEMHYGVLVDLARKILHREPIDISMGYVNVIWQGDANAMILSALDGARVPPLVLNVAGPEKLRVREVAESLAKQMGQAASFSGQEAADAFLSNGQKAVELYGPPRVTVNQLIQWTARWILEGKPVYDKPTHFQNRGGQF